MGVGVGVGEKVGVDALLLVGSGLSLTGLPLLLLLDFPLGVLYRCCANRLSITFPLSVLKNRGAT